MRLYFREIGHVDPSLNATGELEIPDDRFGLFVLTMVKWYYGFSLMGDETEVIMTFVDQFVRPRFDTVSECPVVIRIDHNKNEVTFAFDQRHQSRVRATQTDQWLIHDNSDHITFMASSSCRGLILDILFEQFFPGGGLLSIGDVRRALNLEDEFADDNDAYLNVQLNDGRIGKVKFSTLCHAVTDGRSTVSVTMAGPNMLEFKVIDKSIMIPVAPLWEEFLEVVSGRVFRSWTFGQQGDD